MKPITAQRLQEAWDYCDREEKSTEFMLQYMQDTARVGLDTVLKFLFDNGFSLAKSGAKAEKKRKETEETQTKFADCVYQISCLLKTKKFQCRKNCYGYFKPYQEDQG